MEKGTLDAQEKKVWTRPDQQKREVKESYLLTTSTYGMEKLVPNFNLFFITCNWTRFICIKAASLYQCIVD
jgi:hypothetical protein